MTTVTKAFLKNIYPHRGAWSRKGNYGKLLVIGGSRIYTGSPAFNVLAAIKSGADLVTLFSVRRSADIVATFSPDIITYPVRGDYLNPWHLREAFELEKAADAVVIGGGIGRSGETSSFVMKFLERTKKPCVVDADAIHIISRRIIVKPNFILTPHSYEFFLLTGEQPPHNIPKRKEMVKKYAKRIGCTILLKGNTDIISDGKQMALSNTGNPFMTKGGTGDTLAGIAGALLARSSTPFEAAAAAAWINGSAGDLAAKEYGESLMAENIIDNIHKVLRGI
jgi:NAD(P)H-hydrate epimerase